MNYFIFRHTKMTRECRKLKHRQIIEKYRVEYRKEVKYKLANQTLINNIVTMMQSVLLGRRKMLCKQGHWNGQLIEN